MQATTEKSLNEFNYTEFMFIMLMVFLYRKVQISF